MEIKRRKLTVILILLMVLMSGCKKESIFTQSNETVLEEDMTAGAKMPAPDHASGGASDAMLILDDAVNEIHEDDGSSEGPDYSSLSSNRTITIYDIEDGYLEVPYYPELPQNEYDFGLLRFEGQFLKYDDPDYETTIGVDVSKFQGDIDWEAVKAQGVDFAIIRLGFRGYGNGKLVTDEFFESNIRNAAAAGLEIGVYFLSQAIDNDEAVSEAEYTIAELEKYSDIPITYPVVVDSEKIKTGVARTVSMSGAEITDTVITYCDTIRSAGYKPAVYANSQWLTTRLDIRRLTDIDVWYADYQIVDNNEPPLYPYPFLMWQYSNHGSIEGIEGNVDLNILFKKRT